MRFSKYLTDVKIKVFFGGIPVKKHRAILGNVGTLGVSSSW
jgi:hypothetical protein